MKALDLTQKPIIGMVHLKALPATAGFSGDMGPVYEQALADARRLLDGGVGALLVENDGDQPYESKLSTPQVAALAAVASRLRGTFDVPLGISAAFNDYEAALSIAKAVGAGFVRIPVFVDTVVAFCGVIGPAAPMAVKLRSRLQAGEVQILADVQVKYTKMLLPAITIEESAKMAQSCGADAIIVTGVSSGDVPPIDAVKRVKQAVAAPVLIGSGIARENVQEQLAIADGAIVGTTFKRDGRIDEEKVRDFMRAYRGEATWN